MTTYIQELKAVLADKNFFPKKRFGQNFLVDQNIQKNIAAALNIEKNDKVVEIGPGLGFLTRHLTGCGHLFLIEKDHQMAAYLKNRYTDNPSTLLEADVLGVDLSELALGSKMKVAGNIPYNITSPILEWLITHREHIELSVLTVQWEVACRLQAKPSTADWGPLSAFVQYHADIEILQKISKHLFYPAPKVDSATIRLRFRPYFSEATDEQIFFSILRRCFQSRRKTIQNGLSEHESLKAGQKPKQMALEILTEAGIAPDLRPENLSMQDWRNLSIAFMRKTKIRDKQ